MVYFGTDYFAILNLFQYLLFCILRHYEKVTLCSLETESLNICHPFCYTAFLRLLHPDFSTPQERDLYSPK